MTATHHLNAGLRPCAHSSRPSPPVFDDSNPKNFLRAPGQLTYPLRTARRCKPFDGRCTPFDGRCTRLDDPSTQFGNAIHVLTRLQT